jgi:PucR C-terminal helix-turn-helix domain
VTWITGAPAGGNALGPAGAGDRGRGGPAAGPTGAAVTAFAEVAPLAHDDENSARLRDTLRIFLQENLSYKATAERLVLHKNTVQYRVRKAEESLQHPVAQDRLLIELALLATQRLGAAVLR